MKGLNCVLLICMGSSYGEVADSWVGITSGKFLCVVGAAKLLCVVDMGSWHLFC
jgi:hypothetical protein